MLFNGTVIIHTCITDRIRGYHFISLPIMTFLPVNGAVIVDACLSSHYSNSSKCTSGQCLWVWYMPSSTSDDLVLHGTKDHRVVVDYNILVPVFFCNCSSGQFLCARTTPVTVVAWRQYALVTISFKTTRLILMTYAVFVGGCQRQAQPRPTRVQEDAACPASLRSSDRDRIQKCASSGPASQPIDVIPNTNAPLCDAIRVRLPLRARCCGERVS